MCLGLKGRLLHSLATGGTLWPDACSFAIEDQSISASALPKVLLVVAHPDDESECAAIIYRITHEFGGIVDQVIVTNGEAGYKYAGVAEAIYQVPLMSEHEARQRLPKIRRKEVLGANKILGIRTTYFLGQLDTGFTLDPNIGLRAWNTVSVRNAIRDLVEQKYYDLVLTLLPESETHGHHKSVAILALEALAQIPSQHRPAIAGVRTGTATERSDQRYDALPEFPLTTPYQTTYSWQFDRRTPLACHPLLDYQIVVNWVIAEHKSQGLFQMEIGRRHFEYFWLFALSGGSATMRWNSFLNNALAHDESTAARETYA